MRVDWTLHDPQGHQIHRQRLKRRKDEEGTSEAERDAVALPWPGIQQVHAHPQSVQSQTGHPGIYCAYLCELETEAIRSGVRTRMAGGTHVAGKENGAVVLHTI